MFTIKFLRETTSNSQQMFQFIVHSNSLLQKDIHTKTQWLIRIVRVFLDATRKQFRQIICMRGVCNMKQYEPKFAWPMVPAAFTTFRYSLGNERFFKPTQNRVPKYTFKFQFFDQFGCRRTPVPATWIIIISKKELNSQPTAARLDQTQYSRNVRACVTVFTPTARKFERCKWETTTRTIRFKPNDKKARQIASYARSENSHWKGR